MKNNPAMPPEAQNKHQNMFKLRKRPNDERGNKVRLISPQIKVSMAALPN